MSYSNDAIILDAALNRMLEAIEQKHFWNVIAYGNIALELIENGDVNPRADEEDITELKHIITNAILQARHRTTTAPRPGTTPSMSRENRSSPNRQLEWPAVEREQGEQVDEWMNNLCAGGRYHLS